MFEIIKVIAETIFKNLSIETILKAKKDKRVNDIGTELFLLYSSLNNILVVGRSIVSELERGLDWLERKSADGELDRDLFTGLDFKLQQQVINILQFTHSIKRLGLELQVIAPEGFVALGPLMFGKLNALSKLTSILSNAKLVSVSEEKLQELIDFSIDRGKRLGINNVRAARLSSFDVVYERGGELNELFIGLDIDSVSQIPAKKHEVIRAYLENRQPGKVLDEIEAIANKLRSGIEKNFSLQDILLNVGDDRCSTDRHIGF